ncbi:MAG: hypothetical protein PWQ10_528 [Patescibacteria group bacterium]|nr:hypothetical protein [Patescibacteria group bacterium]
MKKSKKNTSNNRKNALILLTIIIIFTIAISVMSINTYNYLNPKTTTSNFESAIADDVPTAPEINNNDDIDEVEVTIDQLDLGNEIDLTNLENELNKF